MPSQQTQTAARPASGARPRLSNYTGLGASSGAFAASHRESARGRGPGEPLWTVKALDRSGRVTAFEIQFNDSPPLSDYERLVSATGVRGLPRDHSTVAEGTDCLVYGSPMLKALLGLAYVRVTTTPGTRTADVTSTPTPTC